MSTILSIDEIREFLKNMSKEDRLLHCNNVNSKNKIEDL